jgi:hypothetical protein
MKEVTPKMPVNTRPLLVLTEEQLREYSVPGHPCIGGARMRRREVQPPRKED